MSEYRRLVRLWLLAIKRGDMVAAIVVAQRIARFHD